MRRGFEPSGIERAARAQPVLLEPVRSQHVRHAPSPAFVHNQVNCARFFIDVRRLLGVTPHQAAVELVTRVETIEALENGQIGLLPPWPETARVVMAYAAWAGIDGRPVLSVIADLMREYRSHQHVALKPAPVHTVPRLQVDRIRRAGNAIAHGAIRLPREAIRQVRQRPDRAFYALSFPLAVLIIVLNTSALQASLNHLPRPVVSVATGVKSYFQVAFAPVREGFKWIEVDDPRKRRGDKLPVEHR